jgi:hypothetical protein
MASAARISATIGRYILALFITNLLFELTWLAGSNPAYLPRIRNREAKVTAAGAIGVK